ncbi:CPBP family intramembrane glutamic endopeptidase [Rhodohalobacter halophilus]|uniref:CPBP family intramembrane glutamic endopeptidase n=1 Tax=Rhodohalobacter halophilus TaxID=1812810 RepID=UPI00083F8BDE|nr:type II CAAX endopeptidase family protein [Rhodohalobacter halophilus]
MKILFYNSYENRLRSFWRILIITSILLLSITLFGLSGFGGYGFTIVMAVVMAALLWLGAHKIDYRPVSQYGLKFSGKWFCDFLAGNLLAALAMGGIVLIHIGMGWIDINPENFSQLGHQFYLGLTTTLIIMMAVSFWEETYFRSYLIKNLEEGLHFKKTGKSMAVIGAVILSSAIFGMTHLGNPNATWISTLNISIAGMVFAYPYIITKSIAIPLGMHLSWNYFQGAVFGLPVSGNQFEHMLMVAETTGPETFTGGDFGPEAGAAGLLGLMILLTLNEVYITVFRK